MQTKWILQMPNVYTLGFQWADNVNMDDPNVETSKSDIERLLYMTPSELNLSDFYQTSSSSQEISKTPGFAREKYGGGKKKGKH